MPFPAAHFGSAASRRLHFAPPRLRLVRSAASSAWGGSSKSPSVWRCVPCRGRCHFDSPTLSSVTLKSVRTGRGDSVEEVVRHDQSDAQRPCDQSVEPTVTTDSTTHNQN